MARGSLFKPTMMQRNKVKLLKADGWSNERIAAQLGISRNTLEKAFPEEIEFGADAKRMEILQAMERAAKKGNASAGKWLHDRFAVALAARQIEERASKPGEEEAPRPAPLGKKERQQQAAEQVTGKFAPPPPPKLH